MFNEKQIYIIYHLYRKERKKETNDTDGITKNIFVKYVYFIGVHLSTLLKIDSANNLGAIFMSYKCSLDTLQLNIPGA